MHTVKKIATAWTMTARYYYCYCKVIILSLSKSRYYEKIKILKYLVLSYEYLSYVIFIRGTKSFYPRTKRFSDFLSLG